MSKKEINPENRLMIKAHVPEYTFRVETSSGTVIDFASKRNPTHPNSTQFKVNPSETKPWPDPRIN